MYLLRFIRELCSCVVVLWIVLSGHVECFALYTQSWQLYKVFLVVIAAWICVNDNSLVILVLLQKVYDEQINEARCRSVVFRRQVRNIYLDQQMLNSGKNTIAINSGVSDIHTEVHRSESPHFTKKHKSWSSLSQGWHWWSMTSRPFCAPFANSKLHVMEVPAYTTEENGTKWMERLSKFVGSQRRETQKSPNFAMRWRTTHHDMRFQGEPARIEPCSKASKEASILSATECLKLWSSLVVFFSSIVAAILFNSS